MGSVKRLAGVALVLVSGLAWAQQDQYVSQLPGTNSVKAADRIMVNVVNTNTLSQKSFTIDLGDFLSSLTLFANWPNTNGGGSVAAGSNVTAVTNGALVTISVGAPGVQTNGGTWQFGASTNLTATGNTNGASPLTVTNVPTATAPLVKMTGTNSIPSSVNASGSVSIGTASDNGPGSGTFSNGVYAQAFYSQSLLPSLLTLGYPTAGTNYFYPTGTNMILQLVGTNSAGQQVTNYWHLGTGTTSNLLNMINASGQSVLIINTNGGFILGTNRQLVLTPAAGLFINVQGGVISNGSSTSIPLTVNRSGTPGVPAFQVQDQGANIFQIDGADNLSFTGLGSGNGGGFSNLNAGMLTGYVYTVNVDASALWPGDTLAPIWSTNTPGTGTSAIQSAGPTIKAWQISTSGTNNLLYQGVIPQYYGGGAITAAVYVVSGTNSATKVTNVWSFAASTAGTALGSAVTFTNNIPGGTGAIMTNWASSGITIAGSPRPGSPFELQVQAWGGSPYWTSSNLECLVQVSITFPVTNATYNTVSVP